MHLRSGLCLASCLIVAHAHAAVQSVGAAGFTVTETATVHTPPARAYAALRDIAHWWNGQHSFSGSALNLRLDLTPGGCLCEILPQGGFARHLQVDYVDPGKQVLLHGALGPLMDQGVAGAMQFTFTPAPAGAAITLTYSVGGYLEKTPQFWAPRVDRVLADQVQRLARFIDTGRAEAIK